MNGVLAGIPLPIMLKALPSITLERLVTVGDAEVRRFGKGGILHSGGDRCDGVEIILAGQVGVERISEAGELLVIVEFGPGDILGGNLVFSRRPVYPMSLLARENVILLQLRKEPLQKLLIAEKEFLMAYLAGISDNAGILSGRIRDYEKKSIRDILMAYLQRQPTGADGCRVELGMSKKALAERIGIQRTSLSRELQKMKADGLVTAYDHESITLAAPR